MLPAYAGATPCSIFKYSLFAALLPIWKSSDKMFTPPPNPISPTILAPEPAKVMEDVFMEGVDTLPVMSDPAGASCPGKYVVI